ncbi:MAG: M14 family metallocarboxypeptidase [Planctomycetes bacterium]|nr:M14 family metallocarboxypeptidase [Planctomycetota bacterium]
MIFFASVTRKSLRKFRIPILLASCLALALFSPLANCKEPAKANEGLPTPLESAGFKRLSTSKEISAYLARLDRRFPQARVEMIGTSVQGRPIQALILSDTFEADVSTSDRLTVEIIGCQHGTESAGAESLLFIARELLSGSLQDVLNDVDVVLIPNANPDGRDNGKRANANGVNLNVDFITLTQPESRALVGALEQYRPEVVLDVHESAVLKRKSLALEGYMTDFVVQVEFANNPNIAPALETFSRREVLTPWIAAVSASGLRCHRYIGEIRSSRQPITNGGLSLRNLRNRAGIEGALSFLMETRLDPREGDYPTFRNIGERVNKQRVSIEQFLKLIHGKRAAALVALAAAKPQAASVPLALDAKYVAGVGHPRASLNLRRISDGKLERINFADHRTVAVDTPLPLPTAYLIRKNQAELAELFDRHGIEYRTLDAVRTEWAIEFAYDSAKARATSPVDKLREQPVRLRALPGDLWVGVDQPRGRLAALILEPRSTSSIFRTSPYAQLVVRGKSLAVYRVPR